MKKTTSFLMLGLCAMMASAQCINSNKFPLGDVTADNGGLEIQINTCSETDEFTVLTGLNVGEDYTFTITDNFSSLPEYITVTDASNTVIVHGESPIAWTATTGTIRLHWTEDAACGTQASCHTTTYQNTTNTPMPPANDDIAGAIALSVGSTACQGTTTATNVEATASEVGDPSIPAPTCANYQGGDVWFTVEVPATGEITVEATSVGGSDFLDSGMSIYSGTPGSLTQIECDDDDSLDGLFSLIALSGRTPGETLYVRVWEFQNNAFGEFNICAWSPTTLNNERFESATTKVYPNPIVDGMLSIQSDELIQQVELHDILGKRIFSGTPESLSASYDIGTLKAGVYLLRLATASGQQSLKVIKQ